MKTLRAFLVGFLACGPAAAVTTPAGDAGQTSSLRQVTVEGEGEARALPDELVFSVAVWREDREPHAARVQMAAIVARLLAVLKDRGVADADVQTAQASLEAQYRYEQDRQVLTGYRASTVMTVRLRKLEAYDGLIGDLTQAGANEFRGARFESSRAKALAAEARVRAVEDARTRAETLAKTAGARLGRIRSLTETSGGQLVPSPMPTALPMRGMLGGGAPDRAALAPGEIVIRVLVQATWELSDP